jgi:hypothetical protein
MKVRVRAGIKIRWRRPRPAGLFARIEDWQAARQGTDADWVIHHAIKNALAIDGERLPSKWSKTGRRNVSPKARRWCASRGATERMEIGEQLRRTHAAQSSRQHRTGRNACSFLTAGKLRITAAHVSLDAFRLHGRGNGTDTDFRQERSQVNIIKTSQAYC